MKHFAIALQLPRWKNTILRSLLAATVLLITLFTLMALKPAEERPVRITYDFDNQSNVPWNVRINWVNANNVTGVTSGIGAANSTTQYTLPGAAVDITAVRIIIPANTTPRATGGCDGVFHPEFNVNGCTCPGYIGHRFRVDFDHWDCALCAEDGPPCPYDCGTGTCDFRGCTLTQVN